MQRACILTTAVFTTVLMYVPRAQADDALPTLTFQADPSGKGAKLKAGFDLRNDKLPARAPGKPARGLISTIISPFFEGSTDNGAADLFVLDSKGISASSNWNIGAVLSSIHWPTPTSADRDAAGNSPAYEALVFSAYQACSKYCESGNQQFAGTFCGQRDQVRQGIQYYAAQYPDRSPILTNLVRETEESEHAADDADTLVRAGNAADPSAAIMHAKELRALAKARRAALNQELDQLTALGMSIGDICPTQRPELDSYLHEHYDAWSSIPTNVYQIGASVGVTVNKYLAPGAGDELTLRSGTHSSQTVGAMLIYTFPHWTLEAPLVLKRKFKLATTDTAKWCVPVGQVIGDRSMTSSAETCNETPIGPLRRHYSVDVAAFVSRLSPSNFWRIGLGPVLSFSPKADGESHSSYRIGVAMPLYIGTNLLKKDLKGLARLSIGAFTSRASDGKTDCSLTVNIAILATTTLFPSVFDQF